MTCLFKPGNATRLLVLVSVFVSCVPARGQESVIDTQMYDNPRIPLGQAERVLPPGLPALWLRALDRPEADFKRQAAAAIGLGHRRSVPGLESTVEPLLHTLELPDQDQAVRLAVAQALITMDVRKAAPVLFKLAQTDGIDMLNLVEPALARWDYQPVRQVWLDRINQPALASRSWVTAIEGLATVHETKAIGRLHELIFGPATDPIVRFEAARSLGLLQPTGLEEDAERLAVRKIEPGDVSHLAAASLLAKHHSDRAMKILERLALASEPAAALIAIGGLMQHDPRLVVALIPRLSKSPDPVVRGTCIEAFNRNPTAASIPVIADLMDDLHPTVRRDARKALAAKKAEFRKAIENELTRLLAGDHWRGLEQAIILAVELDFKPAATRIAELLRFTRPEVFVTAAWGLRKLAVPSTYAAQFAEIERRWRERNTRDPRYPIRQAGEQVAQLCESLGQAGYTKVIPALMRFIPKTRDAARMGPPPRVAAIWALGMLQQKSPPESLIKVLIERLTDVDMMYPENDDVRTMCAISLGRMKAKEAVDDLQSCFPERLSMSPLPCACAWALEQITGKVSRLADKVRFVESGWFLEPNNFTPERAPGVRIHNP